jgi:hypothetical protein
MVNYLLKGWSGKKDYKMGIYLGAYSYKAVDFKIVNNIKKKL